METLINDYDYQPYQLISRDNVYIESEEMSDYMYKLMDWKVHLNRDYSYDDIGTAQLIADLMDNKIKYCYNDDKWYIWDGKKWARQTDSGIIADKIQSILNLLLIYCDEQTELGEDISNFKKYVHSIRKNTAMKNIAAVLKNMVRIGSDDFDKNPYILNTPFAAYDLKTGKIIDRDKDTYITMSTPCNVKEIFDDCDRWYTFIDEIMSHDQEKAKFLQRALGYSLLGTNREECMFVAYGAKTRNGKGTLFHAIEKAIGSDYYGTSSPEIICELGNGKRIDFNAPQPALAKLVGKRFCVMSEADRDHRLDVATIKYYTGRDTVITRGLYEGFFDFIPQFTLWLETNYLPSVTDDTIFRSERIWVINFNETFQRDKRDNDLKDLFAKPENRHTILKWLFDGCRDYVENGLQIPESVKADTLDYQRRHDRIGMFLDKVCEEDSNSMVQRGTLYTKYRTWCNDSENRYKPLGSTTFYQELDVRGYHTKRTSDARYIEGLKFRETD